MSVATLSSWELFKPITDPHLHLNLHHGDIDALSFVSISKKDGTQWKQFHYMRQDLQRSTLPAEWGGENVYVSMNTFFVPKRRAHYVRQLRAVYCDLDFYKVPEYAHLKPEWLLSLLEENEFQRTIPIPNYVTFSGRGLQMVYLLEAVPGTKPMRRLWRRVQQYLYEQLKEYGADPQCKDESRVFRLAGSIHPTTKETVTVLPLFQERYTMEEWLELWLDEEEKREISRKPFQRPRKPSSPTTHAFTSQSLLKTRLQDFKTLAFLRKRNVTGKRELLLWLYRYHLIQTLPPDIAEEESLAEILSFNELFSQPLSLSEVTLSTKSAVRMWQEGLKPSTPSQSLYPHVGFRFTNQKLIELLEITPEEESYLKCIISPTQKRERRTEKRRKQGIKPREIYENEKKERKLALISQMKKILTQHPLIKNKDLAAQLNITPARVSQLKKEQHLSSIR